MSALAVFVVLGSLPGSLLLKALALEVTADWLFDRDHLAHHVGHTAFVLRGSSISIVAGCYYIVIFGA